MTKKQLQDTGVDKQKNKTHKTLREKLKKKRVLQKEHLKQKKQKRKLFNPQQQKRSFFVKHFNSIDQVSYKDAKKQFKYKKIKKYIQKFINIYQDDLQDFFGLFKQFDEAGFIDISGLQNKKLQKVLLKMFRYLPLNVEKKSDSNGVGEIVQYRKKKQSKLNLQNAIRNLVTQAVENYLQNGTQDQNQEKSEQDDGDSSDNQKSNKVKKNKNNKNVTVNIRTQQQGVFTLPKPKVQQVSGPSFGPCISQEERQKIAQLFQKQIKQMQNQKHEQRSLDDDKFEMIFSMGQETNKLKNPIRKGPKKSALQDVPDHLLAEGSAKIGEKVAINDDDQEEYNALYRPKKLIDQHRQIMAINRGEDPSNNSTGRKPFDRERDVVNSRSKLTAENIQNGLFFNFKDKMTAPKKTNNFL